MSGYDMATPEVWLKDGEYRMRLDLLVGTDEEVAAAFEAAAEVIRRIQGTAKKDVAVEPTPSAQLLEWAQMLPSRWPVARRHLEALADWLHGGSGDFTPPVDLEAIAAAERRGADKQEEEIIGFIDGLATTKNWESAGWIAELIRQGDHLYGGESDDS